MTRQHPLARLFVQSDGGVDGEGSWLVTVGEAKLVAVVQPWKDIPGEKWIARAWHPGLGTFLGGGGQDACDAALAVVEDYYWVIGNQGKPRVAISYDPNVPRRHRADAIDQSFPTGAMSVNPGTQSNGEGVAQFARDQAVAVTPGQHASGPGGSGIAQGPFDDDSFGGDDDDAFG